MMGLRRILQLLQVFQTLQPLPGSHVSLSLDMHYGRTIASAPPSDLLTKCAVPPLVRLVKKVLDKLLREDPQQCAASTT